MKKRSWTPSQTPRRHFNVFTLEKDEEREEKFRKFKVTLFEQLLYMSRATPVSIVEIKRNFESVTSDEMKPYEIEELKKILTAADFSHYMGEYYIK